MEGESGDEIERSESGEERNDNFFLTVDSEARHA